jgi:hypothetical protein
MGFDAIRVPWRVALDNIWYQYPAAGKWCKNVWDAGLVKPAQAGMFTLSSKTSGALWGWGTADNSYADAQYEKYFTAAMWAACAVSVKDSGATQASAASSLKNYVFNALRPDAPYFTLLDETAAKNYYSQTLALFGSLAIVGRAWNVWDDLKKPWVAKDTSIKVTTPLAASASTVTLGTGTTVISAKLAKSIAWTVTFTGMTSGRVTSKTGTGTDISFSWTPSTGGTKPYVEEDCKVELTGGGWATAPTITLKLTKSAGIATRMRAASALAWTNEGLIVPAGAISTGVEYSLREMDLQGKVVALYPSASAQLHDANLLLPIQRAKTQPGLRILEARGSDGSVETLTLPLSR